MYDIRAVKRVTVTEQIMEQIAQLITSGQIEPGKKLPNERELAEQFKVTRGRVREALRALSLIGLITIKPGEGTFVKEQEVNLPAQTITWMFHNELHNLDEVYAARKLIESEVYLTASASATSEQYAALDQMLQSITHAQESESAKQFLDLLDAFDLYMGKICGNLIYGKLMQTIVHLRRETSLKLLNVPGAIEQSVNSRSRLLDAFKSKDPENIKKSVDSFFDKSKEFYDSIIE